MTASKNWTKSRNFRSSSAFRCSLPQRSILRTPDIQELGYKEYTPVEAIKIAKEYVEHMRDLALTIRKEADQEDCFVLTNLMEDHVTGYDKHIWFLNNMLK